jgi:hypothetical protein
MSSEVEQAEAERAEAERAEAERAEVERVEVERAVRRPLFGAGAAGRRLGIDQPAGWWPTTPRLKAYDAAGFQFVQVRMPPREGAGGAGVRRRARERSPEAPFAHTAAADPARAG